MRKIVLLYNKYRKVIWRTIGIIIILMASIRFMEWIWTKYQNQRIISQSNIETNFESINLGDTKSTVSGKNISKTQEERLKTIDKFIEHCNNNEIENAYNLLSEDCKKQLYPNVNKFNENYYNEIFKNSKKDISVENWIGDIYKVKFVEDALSTGIYNKSETLQDYITILEDEQGNTKLNINSYIGKENIAKEKDEENIKIQVIEKHTYMDFEIYTFKITNNSNNKVLINDIDNTNTLYLQDRNELKYYAYMHELSEAELELIPGETKMINIKFYNKYSSSKDIEKIVFSNIILNYSAYKNYQNIGYYSEYGNIQIKL